jgi:hypothetical protein
LKRPNQQRTLQQEVRLAKAITEMFEGAMILKWGGRTTSGGEVARATTSRPTGNYNNKSKTPKEY